MPEEYFVIFSFFEFSVEVNLDQVRSDWVKTDGQYHIKTIATHYGIYEHLFGFAYFLPRIPLNIQVMNKLVTFFLITF